MLQERTEDEMCTVPDNFKSEFNRLKYDFETPKNDIYTLISNEFFQKTLSDITGRELFMTFELCFELKANVSAGFPWHVGVQSFGYQAGNEFGCSIWAPLHSVNKSSQSGGMSYVPENIVSGRFIYDQIEPAITSTLEAKEACGISTTMEDYFALRSGVLNSPAMLDILEMHAHEDNFEPGDVLLFNKYVVHRSVKLEEGPLNRRAAFVMRFVDSNSCYDLQRAKSLEYPTIKYGYKQFTRSHMEINVPDGGLLSESKLFDNKELRLIRM